MKSLRIDVLDFAENQYGVKPEYLWRKFPGYAVFRNKSNKKWFALIANVAKDKLGLRGEGEVDILNVKCDPIMVDILAKEKGFLPAYHMNKQNWLTILLDGSCALDEICQLIDISFNITKVKKVSKK